MALEYPPITGMDYYRLTRLQSRWESRFPEISDVPGAPPTPQISNGQFMVAMGEVPRRIWAEAPNSGLLVQTQIDRLILNWRRDQSDHAYPGYFAGLRPEYEQLWSEQAEYLDEVGLSVPRPHLAEFTYVNTVNLDPDDSIADVVTLLQRPQLELPGTDSFGRFQFIRDWSPTEEAPFAGQIHIAGEPQVLPDGMRALIFTIVARVIPQGSVGPLESLDAAHALASHTFSRIVTESKQAQWGRIQ